MSKVAIITTGGTIAMVHDPLLGVIPSDERNKHLNEIPQLKEIAETELIEFTNIPSPHMTPTVMFELSKFIKEIIKRDDITGVVITHGTDTLEETAYFLDLVMNEEKPIVLTAAMRNWNEPSTDGPANLISSVRVAKSKNARNKGVLVCLNDEIHSAREVTKTYTSNVATFDSPGYGPLGIVDEDAVIFYRTSLLRMHLDTERVEEKVALIKTYTGDDGSILRVLPELGYKGVVIEGFGRGNVPPKVADNIEWIIKEKNIPVIVVSRCFKGRVLGVYGYHGGGADLKNKGAIFGNEVSGQKARIKLTVALGITDNIEELRKYFEFNGDD
ncbi:asparaginase [Marinitoga sp. 1135]|uniref:L-asparaginase/GlutRNAGln amidotransferase subunit D n=1 Tax=Marinitoga piezophila (strain DSM 14283 / JCM 11233 / KA3) TaxID=443254 RepID=H2J6K6_MARPK|nr:MULTISPECIES: asparaginase [Marinitoga]AEX85191.1 L-asparaginase/GlutRNAGln amidotransferase subunit D [Marinitoga piezophila KA3]APT75684.1 asparaginase [Marinitoga sp. 1137]NUU95425.1 asparaginase [Marinitoga sp. 1135]NUU97352.1 asparaginase [Marinitoga sp. 1138]